MRRKGHVPSKGVMRCRCRDPKCGAVFYVESNLGSMSCPHCGCKSERTWGRFQTVFVPEEDVDFERSIDLNLPEGSDDIPVTNNDTVDSEAESPNDPSEVTKP
jgi:hypothetical protein